MDRIDDQQTIELTYADFERIVSRDGWKRETNCFLMTNINCRCPDFGDTNLITGCAYLTSSYGDVVIRYSRLFVFDKWGIHADESKNFFFFNPPFCVDNGLIITCEGETDIKDSYDLIDELPQSFKQFDLDQLADQLCEMM